MKREREVQINVRISYDEARELNKLVEKTGLTKSEYVRLRILGYDIPEKPPIDFYEALKQVIAVGNNINQIARLANATGTLDELSCKKQYDELNRFIIDIKKKFLLPKKETILDEL